MNINLLRLLKTEILDKYIRENFQRLEDYLRDDPLAKCRFKFFSLVLTMDTAEAAAGVPARRSIAHGLGYKPIDIITLSTTNDADIRWKYDDFTTENVVLEFYTDCTVRFLLGRYGDVA